MSSELHPETAEARESEADIHAQAAAWVATFNACIAAGMSNSRSGSGQQLVVDFINSHSALVAALKLARKYVQADRDNTFAAEQVDGVVRDNLACSHIAMADADLAQIDLALAPARKEAE